MSDREWWAEVKAAANAPEVPATQLEIGVRIAWTLKRTGAAMARVTYGISAVHRHIKDGKTYCGLKIPASGRHVPPAVTLGLCPRCERFYALEMTPEDIHHVDLREAARAIA
jgi:hypothetical protein